MRCGITLCGADCVAFPTQDRDFVTIEGQQGVAVAKHGEKLFTQLTDARAGIQQPPLIERQAGKPVSQCFTGFPHQFIAVGIHHRFRR
ncbi:hypothetical protein D3C80_2004630 [compost metagenome]